MGITVGCGYMPHSLMQQLRTHRIAVTFDVMSFRYNSECVIDAADLKCPIDKTFYLRPVGAYSDRKGNRYDYTHVDRNYDLNVCKAQAERYKERIQRGFSEEHARGRIVHN